MNKLIIRDCTFSWVNLTNPSTTFETPQWEMRISTKDPLVARVWADQNLSVKIKGEDYTVGLKRSVTRKDGTKNAVPVMFDKNKEKMTDVRIGNGSTGNVKVLQYPYDVNGRKGIASQFIAIQVTNLVEYATEEDF